MLVIGNCNKYFSLCNEFYNLCLWSERGYIGNTLPLLPLVSSHANPTTWYQSLGFDYFPQPLTISAPLRFYFFYFLFIFPIDLRLLNFGLHASNLGQMALISLSSVVRCRPHLRHQLCRHLWFWCKWQNWHCGYCGMISTLYRKNQSGCMVVSVGGWWLVTSTMVGECYNGYVLRWQVGLSLKICFVFVGWLYASHNWCL